MAKSFKGKQKLLLQHYPRTDVQLNVCYNVVALVIKRTVVTLIKQIYRHARIVFDYRIDKVALG